MPSLITPTLTMAIVRSGQATVAQLREAIPPHKDVFLNRRYVEGNHWQDGEAWVGPGPSLGDPDRRSVLTLIKRAFVSRNVIDEIIDRLVSAVAGKEPRWRWAPDRPMEADEEPTADEATLIEEINSAQTWWWNKRRVHNALKEMLYKMMFGQRATWRLYIPPIAADASGAVTGKQGDLRDAFGKIYLDTPEPEDAGIWEDVETKAQVGIVIYKDVNQRELAEVTYLDETGKTVVQVVGSDAAAQQVTNDFSGAVPIFEIKLGKIRINEQLRALNRSLNMTLTLLQKGLVDNHFLERLMLNAMPPGHWEYAPEPDPETGEKIRTAYVADRHVTGGRQTTYVQGVDFTDESGRTNIKDPNVVFREPTSPEGTIKGADFWYGAMLDEARQAHVIVNQASAIGFKSREQARGDFIDSTNDPQTQCEIAGAELLLSVAKIAESIANIRGKYTGKLRPIFKCRPNYGPLTPAERTQNIAEAKDGYMADETAMALNGIDDTDAEMAEIQAQPRASLSLSALQAETVKKWTDAGFTMEVALKMIGMDDEEVKKIMKMNADSVETAPALPPTPVPPGPELPQPPVAG